LVQHGQVEGGRASEVEGEREKEKKMQAERGACWRIAGRGLLLWLVVVVVVGVCWLRAAYWLVRLLRGIFFFLSLPRVSGMQAYKMQGLAQAFGEWLSNPAILEASPCKWKRNIDGIKPTSSLFLPDEIFSPCPLL
jgi:hypothetical protein